MMERVLEGGSNRGQTLPDFVVAVAIFLLVIAFVISFIPQLTAPYDEQEHPAIAERIASDVAGTLLADRTAPSGLNEECTVAFFTAYEANACPFEDEPLIDRLGVSDQYSVNVSIGRSGNASEESAILCGRDGSIASCDEPGAERLTAGPLTPESDRSVAISRRAAIWL